MSPCKISLSARFLHLQNSCLYWLSNFLMAPGTALLSPGRSAGAVLAGGMPRAKVSLPVICKVEADLPKAEWGADTLIVLSAREGSGSFATCFDGCKGIFSSHLRRPQIVEQQEGMLAAKRSWIQSCKMISKLSLSTAFCRGQEHGFGARETQTDFCLAQQQREICQDTSAAKLETGPTAWGNNLNLPTDAQS